MVQTHTHSCTVDYLIHKRCAQFSGLILKYGIISNMTTVNWSKLLDLRQQLWVGIFSQSNNESQYCIVIYCIQYIT